MTAEEKATYLIQHPAMLGRALGFKDFKDELHGVWITKMLKAKEDMTLQAHRGSYKTTCLCVVIALLMIWHGDKNIIFMRKTDSDVAEVIKAVDRIVNTDVFRDIYAVLTGSELVITKSTNSEISLSNYKAPRGIAQLLGVGTNGSLTGKHADIIITDDIINLKDRTSRAERERTKAIYQELQNIKNKDGRIINTGTPWHKDDAFSIMPPAEKWDCYSTGLLSEQQIADLKSKMTASLFAANYELRHIAEDDVIFDNPQLGADTSLVEQGYSHVDAAYYGEDYTAFTVINYHDGKFYVFGKCWRKHIDDVEDAIIQIHNDLKAGKMYIETNGDKGYVERAIRKKGLRVVGYTESQNKYIKITSHLKGVWKDVVFVKGTDDEYINQITDYNENAEHDDCPDSLASIIREVGVRLSKKRRKGL